MTRGGGGKGKRERSTSAAPPPLSKRLRRPFLAGDPHPAAASASPSQVVVTGLPSDCSVLVLKSRLEQFGSISRIRIDGSGCGHVTFRSDAAAQAAILASLELGCGIRVGSSKVLVVRPTEPPMNEKPGTATYPLSKLLRAEPPLRKHGRSNKKLTGGDVIPSTRTGPDFGSAIPSTGAESDLRPKGRELVAYDDLF